MSIYKVIFIFSEFFLHFHGSLFYETDVIFYSKKTVLISCKLTNKVAGRVAGVRKNEEITTFKGSAQFIGASGSTRGERRGKGVEKVFCKQDR